MITMLLMMLLFPPPSRNIERIFPDRERNSFLLTEISSPENLFFFFFVLKEWRLSSLEQYGN